MGSVITNVSAFWLWSALVGIAALLLPRFLALPEPPTIHRVDSQHIHDAGVPRIGGLIITLALASMLLLNSTFLPVVRITLACALPAFIVGLVEDIRHQTSPWTRYAGCIAASLLFTIIVGPIPRFDIAFLDHALTWSPFAIVVSAFCIAGVTQAFNIVDGKNGLSSGMSLIALLGMALAAWSEGDSYLKQSLLMIAAPVSGFWIINVASGRPFLGDSGAYLLGFIVGTCGVLLSVRLPGISPWLPVALIAYPIVETLFAFFRRVVIEQKRFSDPDFLHLHSLIYERVIRATSHSSSVRRRVGNSTSAAILLAFSAIVGLIALRYRHSSLALQWVFLSYVVAYLAAYRNIRRIQKREGDATEVEPEASEKSL